MQEERIASEHVRLAELLALAEIGIEQGQWQRAKEYLRRAEELAPRDPGVLWGLARVARDDRSARVILSMLLGIAPDHPGGLAMRRRLAKRQTLSRVRRDPSASPRPFPGARWPTWKVGIGLAIAASFLALAFWLPSHSHPEPVSIPDFPTAATALPLSASASDRSERTTDPHSEDPSATPHGPSALARAQLATVLLIVPHEGGQITRGSGTIVSGNGLVLTNHHLITASQILSLSGQPILYVGLSQDPRQPPSLWYISLPVAVDAVRDLAALRIVAHARSGDPVRGQVFETALFGTSQDLALGQGLYGLGYPALGGETLTLTRGSMAGFRSDAQGIALGKTDSELLPGSSGGAVLDDEGRLVGVITSTYTDQRTQGRLSYFLLIQEAEAFLAAAKNAHVPAIDLREAAAYYRRLSTP